MSEAAVSFVLENLKQILLYNAHLITDVKDNVDKLCNELEILNGLLKGYTEMNSSIDSLKKLRKEIKDVVSDAEDVVDNYIVLSSQQNARKGMDKVLKAGGYGGKLRDLGKQIEQVSRRVKAINEDRVAARLEAVHIQEIANEHAKKKQVN